MEIISRNLSIYFKNVYDFVSIMDRLGNMFNDTFNEIKDGTNVPVDFKIKVQNYPKYPIDVKYIPNAGVYDISKIRESTTDSVSYLIDLINENAIDLKASFDLYPVTRQSLINDIKLQYTYFTSINDLYPRTKYFLNYNDYEEYDNLFYQLLGTSYHSNHDDVEFAQQWVTFNFLVYMIPRISNFKTVFSQYILGNDVYTNEYVSNQFNNYVTDSTNLENISENLAKIISKNIYQMLNVSSATIALIKTSIKSTITNELGITFDDTLTTLNQDPNIELVKIVSDCYLHTTSLNLLTLICQDNSVILSPQGPTFIEEGTGISVEDDIINTYFGKFSLNSLKYYLYLTFLYKFWPIKFLNTINIICQRYTETEVMPSTDSYLTSTQITNYINRFRADNSEYNYYDFVTFTNLLTSQLNDTNIETWCNTAQITKFSTMTYLFNVIDNFIDSDSFFDFIGSMLRNVNSVMKSNGFVDYDDNWYGSIDTIKLFFKSLFRSEFYSENFFNQLIIDLSGDLTTIFGSGSIDYTITQDIVEGTFDGFSESTISINNVYNLFQNIYLGSVTKIISSNVLNYFALS